MRLNKRSIAIMLARVPRFSRPRLHLEQYVTDPDVAAELLTRLLLMGFQWRVVADFGCGTGMLSYALALGGLASYIVCMDIDVEALLKARDFISVENYDYIIDFVVSDALRPPIRHLDAVIMNPPFGIRSRRGLDIAFLKSALRVSRFVVSLHAWSDGLLDAIEAKTGCKPRVLFEAFQRIPQVFDMHRRRVHHTKVIAIVVNKGMDCG